MVWRVALNYTLTSDVQKHTNNNPPSSLCSPVYVSVKFGVFSWFGSRLFGPHQSAAKTSKLIQFSLVWWSRFLERRGSSTT